MKNISVVFILSYMMLVSSCAKKEYVLEQDDVNTITSLVLDDVVSKILIAQAFSPKPPDPSLSLAEMIVVLDKEMSSPKDTIKILRLILKEQGKIIVALDTFSNSLNMKNIESQKCIDASVLNNFFNTKNSNSVDLNLVRNNDFADIVFYKKKMKWKDVNGRFNFDVSVSISNISIDNKKRKAIVTIGVGLTPLWGYSLFYYLEKEEGLWKIACKE